MRQYRFVIMRSGLKRWVWELVDVDEGSRVLARSPRSYRRRRKAFDAAEHVRKVAGSADVVQGPLGTAAPGTTVYVARLTPLEQVQPIVVRPGRRGGGGRGQGGGAGRGTSRGRPDGTAVSVPVAQS